MKKLGKKGQAGYTPDTSIFYLVFGIVISFLMVFFMIIIFSHLKDTAQIPKGLEEFSAIERFLSNECFASNDINEPKTLSWEKFTKEKIDKCYNVDKESKKIAFTLRLQIQDKVKEIETNNWNKEIGPQRIKSPLDVNVNYKNETRKGKLIISEQNVQTI